MGGRTGLGLQQRLKDPTGALTLQTPSTTALTRTLPCAHSHHLPRLCLPEPRSPQTEGGAGPIFLQPLWLNLQACKNFYFSARGESGVWSAAGGAVFLSLFPALNTGLGARPQAPAGAHLGQQEAPGSGQTHLPAAPPGGLSLLGDCTGIISPGPPSKHLNMEERVNLKQREGNTEQQKS